MSAKLQLPVENYSTGEYLKFGQNIRRHGILWATHLGDDVDVPAGTGVRAIGSGKVVFSKTLAGTEKHRSWGGIVVLRHDLNDQFPIPNNQSNLNDQITNNKSQITSFYSIYGHLNNLEVSVGDSVVLGQQLGVVANGNTPANGGWKNAHLHFAIYTGPLPARRNGGEILPLPGYWRPEQFWRTKKKWWHNPQEFISLKNE